jgi:8-oxo-dGTP diphosphatase
MWALPGGYVRINEDIEDAAARALAEETGLQGAYLEQLYTFGNLDRDPKDRVVSIAYFALIPSNGLMLNTNNSNVSNISWHSFERLPTLAFDHAEIIAYAIRRLRYKLEYTAVGFQLLPETFTLSQLQQTYEIILGESIDKRNFRRRILDAEVIEATTYKRSDGGRPARLYRYRDDAVAEVKTRRLFP